jgi:hypothetical protein
MSKVARRFIVILVLLRSSSAAPGKLLLLFVLLLLDLERGVRIVRERQLGGRRSDWTIALTSIGCGTRLAR